MLIDLTILITCSVAISLLGALVLFRDPSQPGNRRFAWLSLSIVAWTLFNYLSDNAQDHVLLYTRLTYFAGVMAILAVVQFIVHFPDKSVVNKNPFIRFHTVWSLLLLPSVFFPEFVSKVDPQSGGIVTGTLYYGFFAYVLYSLLVIVPLTFLKQYRKSRSSLQRDQVLAIFWGVIIYAVLSIASNVVLPLLINSWTSSRFGPAFALFFAASVAYSIIRHRLFDIKLAAVRSVAYILSLLVMTGIYFLLAYTASFLLFRDHITDTQGVSLSPVNVFLALILAFVFQPIKHFFDRVTNNIFYRDAYSSDDFFAKLSSLLTSTTDLRGLLETASNEIAATFKAEQVFFQLSYVNGTEHYVLAGTRHHAKIPVFDINALTEYTLSVKSPIFITDMIDDKDEKVRRMLQSHRIALVMPLVMPLGRAENSIGYLLLGDHKSGRYTKRDLNVLSTISSELVIAIQNALSLHELKELNATLQQRIDVATKELRSSNAQLKHLDEVKDEFMSMASHQLRTPLTSVKGYISMVLEGDAGKVSPRQDKLLTEAFKSSERMVRLISDFLNVSRLQTGKFSIDKVPMDIKELVRQEVQNLGFIAHAHEQTIRHSITHDDLPLRADESKVRQVVMNLIDNAIYYSHSHATIVVKLERVGDSMAFTVTDTGIGVPDNEQHKLFSKFFRADNARKQRPDGTGVGLYLARRVVNGHGGSIIFSSKEGKGSTFGFKLPLDTSDKQLPDKINQTDDTDQNDSGDA